MAADVAASFSAEPPFTAAVLEVVTWFSIAPFRATGSYNTVQLAFAADMSGRSFVTVRVFRASAREFGVICFVFVSL
jgi:hypothetical protein